MMMFPTSSFPFGFMALLSLLLLCSAHKAPLKESWRSRRFRNVSAVHPLQVGAFLIPPQYKGVISANRTVGAGLSPQQPNGFCGHPFVVLVLLPRARCWESLQIRAALGACFLRFFLAANRGGGLSVPALWPRFKALCRVHGPGSLQTGDCHPATTFCPCGSDLLPPPTFLPRASLPKITWKGVTSLWRLY